MDEKVFTFAAPVNLQNDRVYLPSGTKKQDIAAECLLRMRPTFSQSVKYFQNSLAGFQSLCGARRGKKEGDGWEDKRSRGWGRWEKGSDFPLCLLHCILKYLLCVFVT